jgi:hypothetical protein
VPTRPERDPQHVNGVPHPHRVRDVQTGNTVRALRRPRPRRAFYFGLASSPLNSAPRRQRGVGISAGDLISSAWRRRYVGRGRRRAIIWRNSGWNTGRRWLQVLWRARRAGIVRWGAGRGTSAAGRLAIIGGRRRVIIVPTAASDQGTSRDRGNCQSSHAPLLCVGGGQESNKSAATGQEEGSGQDRGTLAAV